MSYSKVSDLAKQYGITNEQMMMFLLSNNILIEDANSKICIIKIY